MKKQLLTLATSLLVLPFQLKAQSLVSHSKLPSWAQYQVALEAQKVCGPYLGFAEVESTETIEQVDVGLHEATYELLWEAFPSFHDRRYYVKMTAKITDGPDQYHPSFGHVEVKNISCLEDR